MNIERRVLLCPSATKELLSPLTEFGQPGFEFATPEAIISTATPIRLAARRCTAILPGELAWR